MRERGEESEEDEEERMKIRFTSFHERKNGNASEGRREKKAKVTGRARDGQAKTNKVTLARKRKRGPGRRSSPG